jgi:P pilus assembly protein, chaperone PapD
MSVLRHCVFAAALLSVTVSAVHAGVIIGGTRVIFDGAKKEASISVNNSDNSPFLIQSWIETMNNSAEKTPFIITPPLYRLDKGQQNVERIVLTTPLPQDKESLYWLNIKAIPSASATENSLQIAVKTRIKLIYRPTGLGKENPEAQADKLVWSRAGHQLRVTNPTPFVMNFNEVSVAGKKLDDVSYVMPGASATFNLPAGVSSGTVIFKMINDYGSPGAIHNASL